MTGNYFRNQRRKKSHSESGQSLVEYLIIVALVGVGTMAVMRSVGQNVKVRFAEVITALGGKVDGRPEAETVSQAMYQRSDLKNFMHGALENRKSGGKPGEGDSGPISGL